MNKTMYIIALILTLIFAVIGKIFYENKNIKLSVIFAWLSAIAFIIAVCNAIYIW